jgi:hypothetical protein
LSAGWLVYLQQNPEKLFVAHLRRAAAPQAVAQYDESLE